MYFGFFVSFFLGGGPLGSPIFSGISGFPGSLGFPGFTGFPESRGGMVVIGRTRVFYSKWGEITGKTRVLPSGYFGRCMLTI